MGGVLLLAAYLLQLASPLRLTTDNIEYLTLGARLADGESYQFMGHASHYPPGYPLLVALVDRLGLGSSATFIALNFVGLATGIAGAAFLGRRVLGLPPIALWTMSCLTLLSWITIKHVTHASSEFLYLGLSMGALVLAVLADDRRGWSRVGLVAAAAATAAAAIAVRTVGVTLLPAVVWPLAKQLLPQHGDAAGRRRIIVAGVLLALAGVFVTVWLAQTLYFQKMMARMKSTDLIAQVQGLAHEFGELACNLPVAKLVSSRLAPLAVVVPVVGAVLLIGLAAQLAIRWRMLRSPDIYLAGYLAILAVWPWYDARFLLPILPLIFLYSARWCLNGRARPARTWAVRAYLLLFVALGIVSLAYSTRISLAGDQFAKRYAEGTALLRPTYQAVLGVAPVPESDVEPFAAAVLRRFETRVRSERQDRRRISSQPRDP